MDMKGWTAHLDEKMTNCEQLALVQLHFNNMEGLNVAGKRHRTEITL